jgi:hypothetical protein
MEVFVKQLLLLLLLLNVTPWNAEADVGVYNNNDQSLAAIAECISYDHESLINDSQDSDGADALPSSSLVLPKNLGDETIPLAFVAASLKRLLWFSIRAPPVFL